MLDLGVLLSKIPRQRPSLHAAPQYKDNYSTDVSQKWHYLAARGGADDFSLSAEVTPRSFVPTIP